MAVETRVRFPVTAFPDVALLRRGKISPSWVRTSDLQVNSLTRYRLRHGGTAPRMQRSAANHLSFCWKVRGARIELTTLGL